MKITVAGAGAHGSALAYRIAVGGYADEVVMTDVVECRAQGLALDMMHSRAIEGFETRIVGANGYDETAGSDICIITAGVARKPGMSRQDLFEANAPVVARVTADLVRCSPDSVLIAITNPIAEIVALCAEASHLPRARVIGAAGVLNTARFKHCVAERLATSPLAVEAIVLGFHGETMVAVPSQVTVDGTPLRDLLGGDEIARIVQKTRDGGAEILACLKTGSAYIAPSAAAAVIVRAVARDSGEVLPVCTWVDGPYGITGVYLGVPARLGRDGVTEVIQLPLEPAELAELREVADVVRSGQAEAVEMANAMPGRHGDRRRHGKAR